jgi:hypothetical protein
LKTFNIDGEEYRVFREYDGVYLCISEFGTNIKRIPKLKRVK